MQKRETREMKKRAIETGSVDGAGWLMNRGKATLVCSEGAKGLEWSDARATDSRVIVVPSLNMLRESLHLVEKEKLDVDVVRVIFDRSTDAREWLEFLTSLPAGFRGDVLLIADDGKAFLSATGRGDDRVLYQLRGDDIHFYLEASGVMSEPRGKVLPYVTPADSRAVLAV